MPEVLYNILWSDHKLERGPVPSVEAANILVHWLRTFPDEPVWLLPTSLEPQRILEVALLSAIRRLRAYIEEAEDPEALRSMSLLHHATRVLIAADQQRMAGMIKRIDEYVPSAPKTQDDESQTLP